MGIFRKLFGNTRPARPRTAKPTLEALDERIVPSTASASIHAVTDNRGNSVVFYLQDDCLYERSNSGPAGTSWLRQVWTKGAALTFSAGVGADGYADCFIKAADNSFWMYTYTGGLEEILPGANNVGSFAAAGQGEVYLQNWDNSLWEFSSLAWSFGELAGPGTVKSIDAVTTRGSTDVVFALRQDGTFGEYTPSGWSSTTAMAAGWSCTRLSGPDPIQAGFSAGIDSSGNADVFAKDVSGSLWEWDGGWRWLDAPNAVIAYSATFDGRVDAITSAGTLVQYEPNGTRVTLDPYGDTFKEISVAMVSGIDSEFYGAYSVYTVGANGSGWYFWAYNQNGTGWGPSIYGFTQYAAPGTLM